MKNQNYIYQNCKSARKARRINKVKRWSFNIIFIFMITASVMAINSYLSLIETLDGQSTTYSLISPVEAKESQIKPIQKTPKEQVISILDNRQVSQEFKTKFECLMYNENRSYNPEATYYNKHKDGSITQDMGILMWNSKTAPVKITKECAYNLECSVNTFIDYIKNGGDWNRWFGYKNHCQFLNK